jgi:hypothetical protein
MWISDYGETGIHLCWGLLRSCLTYSKPRPLPPPATRATCSTPPLGAAYDARACHCCALLRASYPIPRHPWVWNALWSTLHGMPVSLLKPGPLNICTWFSVFDTQCRRCWRSIPPTSWIRIYLTRDVSALIRGWLVHVTVAWVTETSHNRSGYLELRQLNGIFLALQSRASIDILAGNALPVTSLFGGILAIACSCSFSTGCGTDTRWLILLRSESHACKSISSQTS